MVNASDAGSLIGNTVIDSDGDKIGTVGQVYLDVDSGAPTWASVRTGFFGTSESFVPLDGADTSGGDIRVPYQKAFVKDAPRVDAEGALQESEEAELYAYYGNGSSGYDTTDRAGYDTTDRVDVDTTDRVDYDTTTTGAGHDTSGPNTDDAMTRSEEQLHVGTEKVQTGRARLRKYVVTDQETVTVPVTHEEVRLEREPITDGNVGEALSGPDISEEEHEVVLTEERPVIAKETVPVERVRLDTETVTENQQVTEEVRKEEIAYEDDTTAGAAGTDRR
jgi:uncharacterized protein (TIGR02271 family)